MNQVLRKGARKGSHITMTNAETNDTTATVAEPGATVATEGTSSKKSASRKKGAPKAKKGAKARPRKKDPKVSKKAAKSDHKGAAPRVASKGAKILEMIGRAKGATLAEIMKATRWQAHSVRGFISTASKKHGVKVESMKSDAGDRVYRAAK
jgi:hypothetical protein